MKHAAYGLLAAFLASGVYGDIPTTAEGWYTPSGGFTATSGTGTIYYGYDSKTGMWKETTVTVDSEGNVTNGDDIPFQRNFDLMTAYQALVKACANEAVLGNHAEAIETIAKNLANPLCVANMSLFVRVGGESQAIRCARETKGVPVVNRRFCPRTKHQSGDNCSAYGVATYLEFIRSYTGNEMQRIDVAKMHGYALANAPKDIKGGNTRSADCLEWAAKQMPNEDYAIAQIALLHDYNDVDEMRAMTIRLVADFGGFLASVETTDEWVLLDMRCAEICRQMFGRYTNEITGRNVKVKALDEGYAIPVSGNHCVVVYGYDDDFVYFQNTWGDTWGDRGHAKITWSEFARQFMMAEVFAPRLEISEWLRGLSDGIDNSERLRIEVEASEPTPND